MRDEPQGKLIAEMSIAELLEFEQLLVMAGEEPDDEFERLSPLEQVMVRATEMQLLKRVRRRLAEAN
jgi:hypothetical protein